MKRLSAHFGTVVLVLMMAATSQVRADFMNWSYTADPNVPGISVGSGSPSGGASVSLTDFNTPQAGAASVPVIAYVTSTDLSTPVNFGPAVNSPSTFNLAMKITDGTKGDSSTLNFTGSLSGSLTATTSSVVASFSPVGSNSVTIDGHTYTVAIPSQTLAPPTSPQEDIMASVSVQNATNGGSGGNNTGGNTPGGGNTGGNTTGGSGGPTHGTPEPTSLLLGCLGFSCFGARNWWKRRSSSRPVPASV